MKGILHIGAILVCSTAIANVSFDVGHWRVDFADAGARLVLSHSDGIAEVSGSLSFIGPEKVTGAGIGKDEAMAPWRVVSSRATSKDYGTIWALNWITAVTTS